MHASTLLPRKDPVEERTQCHNTNMPPEHGAPNMVPQYKEGYQMTILVGLGLVSAIVIYPNTLTQCRAMIRLQACNKPSFCFLYPFRQHT